MLKAAPLAMCSERKSAVSTLPQVLLRYRTPTASIPEALRAELEPKLRNIYRATTPHRMGGPRDLLQNWADPDDDDLLFQIGSDYAMGWMWGDLGALFVYLSPSYLKVRWFKRAHAWIDGH